LSNQENAMFTEAIAALRAGDRDQAKNLLSKLVRLDSSNPEYWLWMSAAADSDRQRILCLKSVLKHDPTNRAALRGLLIMGEHQPDETELSTALQIPQRQAVKPEKSATPLAWINWKTMAGLAAIILIAAVGSLILFQPRAYAPAPTLPPPTATCSPTPLSTPTMTPVPAELILARTPIPTELAGTPLAHFVGIQSTPTAMVGITPHPVYEAYDIALEALEEGEYDECLVYLDQVLRSDATLADVHYVRGEVLRLSNRTSDAEQAYQTAIALDSEFAPAYLGLARLRLAQNPGNLPEELDQAINLDPSLEQAYTLKAEFYERAHAWEALLSITQQARENGITTPGIKRMLAEAQYHSGYFEPALEVALESAIEDQTQEKTYLILGQILIKLERYAEGQAQIKTYLNYAGDDAYAWLALGDSHKGMDALEPALKAYSEALAHNQDLTQAWYQRGLTYLELGNARAALEDLTQAQSRGGDEDRLHLSIAIAHYALGEFEQSQDVLSSLLQTVTDMEIMAEGLMLQATIYESIDPPELELAIETWQAVQNLEDLAEEFRTLAQAEVERIQGILEAGTPSPESTGTATLTPAPGEETP